MKYVAALESYPNCRTCDPGYAAGLRFFNSIKEILHFAVERRDYYAIEEVYSTKTGTFKFEVRYEYGRHGCTGVKFKSKGLSIRTTDDGHGKLIWVRE